MFLWPSSIGLTFLALLLSSCQGETITSTWIPKERVATPAVTPQHAHAKESPTLPVRWTKPASWSETPPSNMRIASFSFKSKNGEIADISVVRLAGDGGGLLANVNRWRGQIGLNPMSQRDMEKIAERLTIDGHPMLIFDFQKGESRMLTAVYEIDGESWYFKMMGSDKTLQEARLSYFSFLKSVHRDHFHHP